MSEVFDAFRKRVEKIVEYMIEKGTAETIQGNYIFDYEELGESFEFICNQENLIVELLDESEKVMDVINNTGQFDICFALEFCKNAAGNEEDEDDAVDNQMETVKFEWCYEIGQIVTAEMDATDPEDSFIVTDREFQDEEQWYRLKRLSDGQEWSGVACGLVEKIAA